MKKPAAGKTSQNRARLPEEFSASIEGNPSDDRLVWYPINGNILSVSKTITESEESLTVSASYFNTTQYVRVAMIANPSIYEDLPVTYVNNIKNSELISVGIFNKAGTSVQSSCGLTSYEPSARPTTWTDHDGTYFYCEKIYRPNDKWYSNPALAMEEGCMIEVTASPGAYIDFKGRIETYKRADTPIFSPEYQFNGADQTTFTGRRSKPPWRNPRTATTATRIRLPGTDGRTRRKRRSPTRS